MAKPGSPDDAYAAAGVRYATIDRGKIDAQRAAAATGATLARHGLAEVAESRGESAYVIDVGDHFVSTVSEALGTKNLVADAVRALTGRSHYDAIARDTVATILNDLCTVGGAPATLTAYWGAGRSEWFEDEARLADLVAGWAAACAEAGCSWGGGETQVLHGMIEPGVVVLGGAAVGLVRPKGLLLLGSRVAPGDAILIAPATGIHANGLTLARKLAAEMPQGYATPVAGDPRGRAYGEVLLDATPLYGPLVEALQAAAIDLHYAVHVTGHGWRKLMRHRSPFTYRIRAVPDVPPVLKFIQSEALLSDRDAYGTFNMGAGFALFVAAEDAPQTVAVANKAGLDAWIAGTVEAGPKRLLIEPLGLEYDGSELGLRA